MNSNIKHGNYTPGPWKFHPETFVIYQNGCIEIASAYRETHETIPMEEKYANARLIASAPELLAELEAIAALCSRTAEMLEKGVIPVTPEGQAKLFGSLAERSSAAIAKAAGQAA